MRFLSVLFLTFTMINCEDHNKLELINEIYSDQKIDEFIQLFPNCHLSDETNNIQYAYLDFHLSQVNIASEVKFCNGSVLYVDLHPHPFSNFTYNDISNVLNDTNGADLVNKKDDFVKGVGYSIIYDFIAPVLGRDTIIRVYDNSKEFDDKLKYDWMC